MQAQANCRVGIAALNTLAGYIDWVSMSHITAENCKLLEMLCLLLNEQELQLGAAECLLIAVSRKVSYHFKLTLTVSEWCIYVFNSMLWWKTFKGLGFFGLFFCFTWHQLNYLPPTFWTTVCRYPRNPLSGYIEICRATWFLKELWILVLHA